MPEVTFDEATKTFAVTGLSLNLVESFTTDLRFGHEELNNLQEALRDAQHLAYEEPHVGDDIEVRSIESHAPSSRWFPVGRYDQLVTLSNGLTAILTVGPEGHLAAGFYPHDLFQFRKAIVIEVPEAEEIHTDE